jgi:hypothetical protein
MYIYVHYKIWSFKCISRRKWHLYLKTTVVSIVLLICSPSYSEFFAFPHHFGICDPHLLLQRALMKCHFLPRHHTVRQVSALLQQSGWQCLKHLPYSPDFAPADFIAMINTNVSSITKFY